MLTGGMTGFKKKTSVWLILLAWEDFFLKEVLTQKAGGWESQVPERKVWRGEGGGRVPLSFHGARSPWGKLGLFHRMVRFDQDRTGLQRIFFIATEKWQRVKGGIKPAQDPPVTKTP